MVSCRVLVTTFVLLSPLHVATARPDRKTGYVSHSEPRERLSRLVRREVIKYIADSILEARAAGGPSGNNGEKDAMPRIPINDYYDLDIPSSPDSDTATLSMLGPGIPDSPTLPISPTDRGASYASTLDATSRRTARQGHNQIAPMIQSVPIKEPIHMEGIQPSSSAPTPVPQAQKKRKRQNSMNRGHGRKDD